jgi:hypothetical protein
LIMGYYFYNVEEIENGVRRMAKAMG